MCVAVVLYMLAAQVVGDSSTAGGSVVILRGTDFGPAGLAGNLPPVVTYAPRGSSREHRAQDCVVSEAHVAVRCVMGAGVGGQLAWSVTVAGLTSSLPRVSYKPPSVTSVALLDG